MHPRNVLFVFLMLLAVAGCKKQEPQAADPVRPVKVTTVVAETQSSVLSLAGEIRARVESPLAFQVSGKVIERKIEFGDSVRRNQVLGRIESNDYVLAAESQAAEVARAQAELAVAEADLKRFTELHDKNFITAAEVTRQSGIVDSARARLHGAEATLAGRNRQVNYTTLVANSDGVITALDFNVGQVVGAGQPMLRLAQPGAREVEVHVPEAARDLVRNAKSFEIRLNALPNQRYAGKLREFAAAADVATRTYTARIAVDAPRDVLGLNMSATVRVLHDAAPALHLPLAAVFSRDGKPRVWKLDPASSTVHAVEVTATATDGNVWLVESGVAQGDVVVVAGVNLLHDNQTVRALP